jgi:hypothetical protein
MVIAGNGIEIRVSDEVLIMAGMTQQEEMIMAIGVERANRVQTPCSIAARVYCLPIPGSRVTVPLAVREATTGCPGFQPCWAR